MFADTKLTIDLGAIARNYKLLRDKVKPVECAAVVKANAYGLGVLPVAKTLSDAGCDFFFVATLDEAIELRRILPEAFIFVFHGPREGQVLTFLKHQVAPVLNDITQVELWKREATDIPCAVHFDTGMNRLGLAWEEHESLRGLEIKLIMSHLACPEIPDHPMNKKQADLMKRLKNYYFNIWCSFANSSGIFLGEDFHGDLVRPGAALYGVNPTPWADNPMESVVTLKGSIIGLRKVAETSTVGYGATEKVPKDTILATCAIGYADGYLRSLSNSGYGYINNIMVPIIGRVSMDLTIFDVTKVKDVKLGDSIELIGKNITIDQIATKADTIGYEILTQLGKRYEREYIT